MAQGDQVKALITVSKARGWDPTVIEPGGASFANFDKAPEIYNNQAGTGRLPGGPKDVWPDSFGPPPTPSVGKDEVDWQRGKTEADNVERATKNADPYAGMGGTAV